MRSEKYLRAHMFSLAVCALCQLLAHTPKVRATVVPVGKALDIHHQLCVEASVLAPCTKKVWNVLFQVPPSDIQTLRPRAASIPGVRRLSDFYRELSLGMDALVTVCSWNMNVILVWAWMLWSPYAPGTQTLLWFGHGCSSHRMLLEHERYYGLGMDALVTICSWNTNIMMVWAWML